MSSLFSFKNGLRFFSFFLIYFSVVLFIGACSCGKMAGGNGNQPGGSGEQGEKSGWGAVTTNAPWSDRRRFEALVFDDKIWVLGGNGVSGAVVADIIWSSPDGTNWTEVTPVGNVWEGRIDFQAEVFNNRMWVIGGQNNASGALGDIWSSSDGTNWTQITPTGDWPGVVYEHQVVVFDNKMWVLGKFFENEILRSDDGTSWTRVTPGGAYWSRRLYHQAAVFDGKMWVVGGDDAAVNFSDVWSSSDGTTWTEHTVTSATPGAVWGDRKGFQMLPFDGKLWVIGGLVDKPPTAARKYEDIWTTTDGDSWKQFSTESPWGNKTLFKAVVFKGKLWILGGADGGSVPRSDIWNFTK